MSIYLAASAILVVIGQVPDDAVAFRKEARRFLASAHHVELMRLGFRLRIRRAEVESPHTAPIWKYGMEKLDEERVSVAFGPYIERHFTLAQIREINDFLETELGRKLFRKINGKTEMRLRNDLDGTQLPPPQVSFTPEEEKRMDELEAKPWMQALLQFLTGGYAKFPESKEYQALLVELRESYRREFIDKK